MSLLSELLPKAAAGLLLATDVLTFAKPSARLVVASTDATASGSTYPRLVLRNAYQQAGSGGEIRFECRNTTPTDFLAASLKGSLTTLTAGAEVGKLDLTVVHAGGVYRGISIGSSAISPSADGAVALGTGALGYAALHLFNSSTSTRVSLSPGATTALAFGGTNLQVNSTGKTFNLAVSATGAGVFNSALGADALLAVGDTTSTSHYSQSNTTTGRGIAVALGVPTNVTATAVGVDVSNVMAAGSFTTTNLYGARINVTGSSGGGTGAAQNVYGLHVTAANGTVANVGVMVASTAGWGVVSAASANGNYFDELVLSDTAWSAGAVSATASVDIRQSANRALFKGVSTAVAPSGTLVYVEGPTNADAYNALKITDTASSNTKFLVRGDGKVFINRATVAGTSGIVSVTGRVAIVGATAYDLGGSLSTDLYVEGTHAVTTAQIARLATFDGTFSMTGTGTAFGAFYDVTASAQAAGNALVGAAYAAASAYAGQLIGARYAVSGTPGHTGSLIGIQCQMSAQAGTTAASGVVVEHYGALTHGLLVKAGTAGSALTYGAFIDPSAAVGTAAYAYQQRAGSTADAFRYVESGGTTRFQIDSAGDVVMSGTGRRIKGDFSDATLANRIMFQSTVTNGATYLHSIPNGSGTASGFGFFDGADPANTCRALFYINTTSAYLWVAPAGTGTQRPFIIAMGGGATECVKVHTNNDVQLGTADTTAATRSTGMPFMPTVAGAPLSDPAVARSSYAPFLYDTSANRLWIHNGADWKYVALT